MTEQATFLERLTEDEMQILRSYRSGQPIMSRCCFGLGVSVKPQPGSYAHISVNPMPLLKPGYAALQMEMEMIVASWSAILREHGGGTHVRRARAMN